MFSSYLSQGPEQMWYHHLYMGEWSSRSEVMTESIKTVISPPSPPSSPLPPPSSPLPPPPFNELWLIFEEEESPGRFRWRSCNRFTVPLRELKLVSFASLVETQIRNYFWQQVSEWFTSLSWLDQVSSTLLRGRRGPEELVTAKTSGEGKKNVKRIEARLNDGRTIFRWGEGWTR